MKIILVNTPTPILIIFHLELNLTVSSIRRWSTGLTKRELPIQWRCTPAKHEKPCLYIIGLQEDQWHTITQVVALNSYDLFLAILVTHIK